MQRRNKHAKARVPSSLYPASVSKPLLCPSLPLDISQLKSNPGPDEKVMLFQDWKRVDGLMDDRVRSLTQLKATWSEHHSKLETTESGLLP